MAAEIVAAISAALAPVLVVWANRRIKDVREEVKATHEQVLSPNGSTTGDTVHAVLLAVEAQGKTLNRVASLIEDHVGAPVGVAHPASDSDT